MSLQFRRAKEDDLDRLVEIHLAAYPDTPSVQARQRSFTQNPFGKLADLIVVEDRGQLVAHAFLYPLRAWFGGARVLVGGIASVGVAPEARGRGVATALMHHLHRLSDRRGDALTMLYAFRQGFYARLGYATTSSRKRLALDPRSVPASWRALARERVRAMRRGDERILPRAYERAAERASGRIVRTSRFWERLLLRETRMTLVCERSGAKQSRSLASRASGASGYVAFSLVQDEAHGATFLEVDELIADDDETRRALFGALAAMRDQVSEIIVEIGETDPLERALLDSDGRRFGTAAVEHSLGEVVGGPMVRIEDVARALEARGYAGSGSFALVVGEPGRDVEEQRAFQVRVRAGRATVTALSATAKREREKALQTTPAGLAAMLYGGLSATAAVTLGLARAEPKVASAIEAIAQIPPLTPIDAF